MSFAQGIVNLAGDLGKGRISMSDERAFEIGRNLAVTPGHVVYRNELIELIQYAPTTARVHRRPLVIVPPCINKYYILDLQPSNSFVRWAVGQGHTVFIISWRNIPPQLGSLTWDDYLEEGVLKALGVAREISRSPTVNALGFCVGGTLLACALAVLAARRERSVESATFLTTMLDFADPGEIGVYVSREFLAAREPALQGGERVHGAELAGAFASLRANELVWNYVVRNYLKGETPPAFDLLHWNGDSANLPGPMYVYYLRNLYLDNRLIESRRAHHGRRTDRPVGADDAGLCLRLARRSHRALALRLSNDRAAGRRRHLRDGRLRPHRGRDQSTGKATPPLLDERAHHRRGRRLARARRPPPGQLVAGLGSVARAAWRRDEASAAGSGECHVPGAGAGARKLRGRGRRFVVGHRRGSFARRRMTAKRRRIDPRQRPARPPLRSRVKMAGSQRGEEKCH